MPYNFIEVNNLHKNYPSKGNSIEVLKGVNFTIDSGMTYAIIGPSGSGKSTLLHQIGLLEFPTAGNVLMEGEDTAKWSDNKRAKIRLDKIGFVFQFHHLLNEFTAVENVMLPAIIAGGNKNAATEKALHLLDDLNLTHRAQHKPGEMSGGEQQRVALARALINEPAIILADEPTGNLDKDATKQMKEIIWSICSTKNTTLVVVTHNHSLAKNADVVLMMEDGVLSVSDGVS